MDTKKIVRKILPSTHGVIKKILQKELYGCKNVVDLGCGERSPLKLLKDDVNFKNLHSVGVDIFSPYIIKNLEGEKIHSEYINKNIFDIDFPEKSFDCAILLDVIEHFEREDFLKFLPRLEKIAKKIIIITPNGFVKQGVYDDNSYQVHRSGWTADDFTKLNFKCFGLSGLRCIYGRIKPISLNTFLSDISQLFIFNKPKLAFHIVAIKKL